MVHTLMMLLLMLTPVSWAEQDTVETDTHIISFAPKGEAEPNEFVLKITNKTPCTASGFREVARVSGWDYDVEYSHINFRVSSWFTSDVNKKNNYTCPSWVALKESNFFFGKESMGTTLHVFAGSSESASASFEIPSIPHNPKFNVETPAENSIQSGVGLIRGWACNARTVEAQIDIGAKFPLLYGGSRADTQEVCGDDDNGYATLINWGVLSKGAHRIKIFELMVKTGAFFQLRIM